MSNEYKTIAGKLIDIFEAQMSAKGVTGELDEDLTTAVKGIKLGRYIPGYSGDKPVVYIMPDVSGLIADMAGNVVRQERMLFLVTAATSGSDQESSLNEAMCLFNNVQNVLIDNTTSNYWSGGKFGWGYGDDDNPEQFGKLHVEPGADVCVASFVIRWSCDVILRRE
jgi:hypothetical protein